MLYKVRVFFRDWWVNIPFILVILVFLSQTWFVLSNLEPTEDLYYLHYNVIFGVDLVGPWWRMLFLPVNGLLIILVNYVISFLLYDKYKFLSYLVSFITVLLEVLLLLGTMLTIRMNI